MGLETMTVRGATAVLPQGAPPAAPNAPGLSAVRSGRSALMEGHHGPAVSELQALLNAAGAQPPLELDGRFGARTQAAVRHLQASRGLVVDGLAGRSTLAALVSTPIPTGRQDALVKQRSETGHLTGEVRRLPEANKPLVAGQVKAATLQALPRPASLQLPEGIAGGKVKEVVDQALAGGLGPKARTSMLALVHAPSFTKLTPAAQAAVLTQVGTMPSGGMGSPTTDAARAAVVQTNANALRRFVALPGVQNAAPEDQQRLIDVYGKAPMAREDLELLIKKGPAGILAPDTKGGRMLDHLSALAQGPLEKDLAGQRALLLSSTLSEAAHPELITQERRGTCSVTAASQMLSKAQPGEYVRLIAGLSTASGTVTLKNGATLVRPAGVVRPDDSGRTPSERLLQASLMEYGNGAKDYDNARDVHVENGAAAGSGLSGRNARAVMEGLFGSKHQVIGTGGFERRGDSVGGDAVDFARVKFGLAPSDPLAVLHKRNGQDTLAGIAWEERKTDGTLEVSAHAVVVERIADGRVYFRNPQGNAGTRDGDQLEVPPRRVEDATGSLQSMAEADFNRRLYNVMPPD